VPAGTGPYPVIVFSHGSLCSFALYDRITAYWAAQGYIVIMPQHLDALENPPPDWPPDLRKLLSSRIRDLSFVLDALPELAACAGDPDLFDDRHVAAAGHSFGALTALIKAGLALKPGEYVFAGSAADARFKAGISISGVGPLPPLADDAFAHLNTPVLVTGGTRDEGNIGAGPVFPWEWRMSAYTLAKPGDKYSLVLNDADHYLGGLIARTDRGGEADPDGVAIVAAVTTAFLDASIKKLQPAADWLATADVPHLTGGRATLKHK
jgi:dienelactone hydrolase